MRRYLIAPIAEQDLEDMVTYIAEESPISAKKMLDRFFDAMDNLAENPGMGHTRTDLTSKPVRFWPIGHYLIIYKDTNPIQIVRVLSGYRDITNLFL